MTGLVYERSPVQVEIDKDVLARVKAGMALLQERWGDGWVDKIDMETLDLQDGYACVLGQLYGDYCRGAHALFGDDVGRGVPYGFMTPFSQAYSSRPWAELTDMWRRELAAAGAS